MPPAKKMNIIEFLIAQTLGFYIMIRDEQGKKISPGHQSYGRMVSKKGTK